MSCDSRFWDRLAPHHAALEDNYFDLRSVRKLRKAIRQPVLVVGAGQGLIVAELRRQGLQCEGLDLSPEMVKYAKSRRGLALIEADAKAMPFAPAAYETIIYATGVIDFIGDEEAIRAILEEGRRVMKPGGKIFIAFYRFSRAQEDYLRRVGLLRNHILAHRQCLEMYLLSPAQIVAWVAQRPGFGYVRAVSSLIRLSTFGSIREKVITFRMQRIFRNLQDARALIQAAPEQQPYRNETEIRSLFQRVGIPPKHVQALGSCYIVQI